MTVSAELIVLHLTKTGDNSIVIHTLSREYGRRSFFVRGVGKSSMMTRSRKGSRKSRNATGSKSSIIRWRFTDDAAIAARSNAKCLFFSKKAVNFHGFFAEGAFRTSRLLSRVFQAV